MKLRVLWVGKTRQEWIRAGIDEYSARIRRYFPLETGEAREEKGVLDESGRERECFRLEKLLPRSARLVLLDERGRELSSPAFAGYLGACRDGGIGELVFAIGGAYGFSETFRARADMLLSLSSMTLTHQMVRVFLLEQIYRGCTILNREPYHH